MGDERKVFLNPTENKVEELLAERDDNLEKIEEQKPEEQNDIQPTDSKTDNGDSGTVSTGETEGESDGFTAADYETEKPEEPEKSQAPESQELSPELKYVVENLPSITTRILVDGQVQEVQVKSFTQLPPDVQFATNRDQLAFMNAMTAQENRAERLQSEFRQNQQKSQTEEFEQRENAAIRQDITDLQKEGSLPKFKSSPDDPEFDKDPATLEVQKVLDFMNKKNQEYLDKWNQGSAYRHIGFSEAYHMMPETRQREAQKVAQQQEDEARSKVAGRVGGASGTTPQSQHTPVRRGISLDEIVDRVEREW